MCISTSEMAEDLGRLKITNGSSRGSADCIVRAETNRFDTSQTLSIRDDEIYGRSPSPHATEASTKVSINHQDCDALAR